MSTQTVTFQSERANIANWRLVTAELAGPEPGQVLVRVDRFALTANNITYGVAGDSIGYWQFFPAGGQWGCIPVWGFGEVIESRHPQVPVGERLYGYFPMSTHVMLQPERVSAGSLIDGASHRAELPAVYNSYSRVAADPGYDPDREAEQMLYRPLFTTSFFIDDFLKDNEFFGASQVILTSASSKTSIGLAHLLHASSDSSKAVRVLGLTSEGNAAFVRGLGCYDLVATYPDVADLEVVPSVLVDMAGSGPIRLAVHDRFADALRYSCAVGATHWDDATIGAGGQTLPGPRPQMFFAPTQIQKRAKEWGREVFDARLAAAWKDFLGAAERWIAVEQCEGAEALADVYGRFIEGTADPSRGYVMRLESPQ